MGANYQMANSLEDKLKIILERYVFLKEENEFLIQKIENLELQHKNSHRLLVEKEENLKTLKIAKTIEGSNESVRDTKLKINTLIREIDKCIIQLNE